MQCAVSLQEMEKICVCKLRVSHLNPCRFVPAFVCGYVQGLSALSQYICSHKVSQDRKILKHSARMCASV